MGLFKVLGCIAGGAVAVVAAPIVAPMAVAAAAAGTAAAGAVAAAGTAAAGAAAAAGTAVAGTAVGGAVIGTATTAAATVGGAVGTAAGAVGLGSVAAATGTTAGAAAVGTITTSVAIGGATGINAKSKLDEAKEIAEESERNYNNALKKYNTFRSATENSTTDLAKSKKEVSEDLLRFNEIFKKIKNPSVFDLTISKEIDCSGIDLNVNFKEYNPITMEEMGKTIIKSYASGQFAGIALTGGISSTIATAGTGTAMSALSGVAATNATMAALGGGTLASGGLGMAGGAIVAKGLVFAPALAIGGILLNSKADEALDKAKNAKSENDKAIKTMDESGKYMNALSNSMQQMSINIADTRKQFAKLWVKIDEIVNVEKHLDASKMSIQEQMVFYAAVGLAKVMEIQIKKTYIKENADTEKLSAKDVVSVKEISKCNHDNKDIINYQNLPEKTLDEVISIALK